LTIAERYAEGELTENKLGFAWGDARRAAQVAHRRQEAETTDGTAMWCVALACEADIGRMLTAVPLVARCEAHPIDLLRLADAQRKQVLLLLCIFGNPFRPVVINSAWLTATVVSLAAVAYEERNLPSGLLDSARLAILADALEDAGCTDATLLDHLRGPGPHVRGCFALDLVLGKT
jgi:hypothetical protein